MLIELIINLFAARSVSALILALHFTENRGFQAFY
jgi:hypothetical protein